MSAFSPVTDAELTRARTDPAFRQKMLEQSLETLLEGIKKLRRTAPSSTADVKQLREGVELAVRLAEILQHADRRVRSY
jgi:phage shock protein A